MMPASSCPHTSESVLRYAPLPCNECRGWVLADRSVIDTRTMLKRYPQMAQNAGPRQNWPDYEGPTAGDRFLEMNRIVGALGRTGCAIIAALAALAIPDRPFPSRF